MKNSVSISLRVCVSVLIGMGVAGSALPNPAATPAVTPALAQEVAQGDVIVILRDQVANVPPVRRAMLARASAVAASQSSVIEQLQHARARKVTAFNTFNGFATNVSADEAQQLSANPSVQAVVPDRVIRTLGHGRSGGGGGNGAGALGAKAASSADAGTLCGTLEPEALQLTNTAFSDPSTASAQTVLDGKGKPVTGLGVKVAFIADGIDTNVAGFIRPDGSHVFIDYQDFSGDPAGTPTAGGEAFGDASSIAAQDDPKGRPLYFDISKFVNAAHPLPSPCEIHIRGMAPGASLVGLKVYSNLGYTTTSSFVQAIEYAVIHDDVDVLNESFGGNPYPDTENDPISLANTAAVAAGVTITVSTGDAAANTLGSPATNPDVIAVGASTQYRSYAQTNYGAQPLATGYVSNNISALSSGGFAQAAPRTVDVVAPGDLGWALCSTNPTLYTDCTNYATSPGATPIQDFGGTSESAPLTAGEAALVIQAYRSTHGEATPSPAVVKQIIMSTATDLGAPASEQGAGLINSLGAVHAALSIVDANGHPGPHGHGFVVNPTSVGIEAEPNTRETQTFKITNIGSTPRHVTAALQTLGAPIAGATLSLPLSPTTDPTFINPTGAPRPYIKHTFVVPKGADHLDASIAYQVSLYSSATPIVYISLLDPSGRQVIYDIPQGLGSGYSHVDVVKPVAGTWTALIWSRPPGTGSYAGPVQFTWAAEKYVSLGNVYPATLDLGPGATQTLSAEFFVPNQPGDLSAAIRFTETDGNYTMPDIPVTLRTLVPVGATGGSFTGSLTGGNGRPAVGPYQTFAFDVPSGVKNLNLAFQTADNGYLLEGVLTDPHGMQMSVEPNLDPAGEPQYGLEVSHYNPIAGRWTFTLIQNFTSSGNQTSLPFTARIGFSAAPYTVYNMPNNASVLVSASGKPVTATITFINSGVTTAEYFADARVNSLTAIALAPQTCAATATLPGTCGLFFVPTEVSSIQFTAKSTVPITMDAYNDVGYNVGGTGSPDLFAKTTGRDTVTASLLEPEIPWGSWYVVPALIGPFGAAGAPTEPVATGAVALLKPWDNSFAADSGDLWADLTLGTNTFNPLVLASGEQGTITLTITPDPSNVGKTFSGYVYIDTYNPVVGTGDEVLRIPYGYTVAP